jgi:hypothetical protein
MSRRGVYEQPVRGAFLCGLRLGDVDERARQAYGPHAGHVHTPEAVVPNDQKPL